MNKELLKAAKARFPNIPVLINAVSKRVRQLHAGQPPFLKPERGEDMESLALREIVEGKFAVEFDFSAVSGKAGKKAQK